MAIAEKSSDDILNLIGLITGKSGSTSGSTDKTSTTKSNITAEGMQSLINDILAGPGGLAQIGNTEKAAGLYGGSTGVLLQNDLIARTAAKLAAAQAGTTTTESGSTKGRTDADPAINPLKALGGLAGVSLLNSLLQGAGVGGISGVTGGIGDLLKAGGSGLAALLGGSGSIKDLSPEEQAAFAASGGGGPTGDPYNPGDGDLSGLTQIPISSLFPSSGTGGDIPEWDVPGMTGNNDSGSDGDGNDDEDYGDYGD